MFTGLIQRVGTLVSLESRGGAGRLRVRHADWPNDPLSMGESIAVEGACLSVTAIHADGFSADVLQETLDRTRFRCLVMGAPLNLERAMQVGDRFGGHIVSGHIDEVGQLEEIRPRGPDSVLRIRCSATFMRGTVQKGSVALNGVSLTVSAVAPEAFEVNIIPVTWRESSLASLSAGAEVHLEADILGKYVHQALHGMGLSPQGVTEESLRRAGFMSGRDLRLASRRVLL